MNIKLKKYGHITKVSVEGKEIYQTAVTPKYEKMHIETLLRALEDVITAPVVDNIVVEVDE